jgi:hypothetical protein
MSACENDKYPTYQEVNYNTPSSEAFKTEFLLHKKMPENAGAKKMEKTLVGI